MCLKKCLQNLLKVRKDKNWILKRYIMRYQFYKGFTFLNFNKLLNLLMLILISIWNVITMLS